MMAASRGLQILGRGVPEVARTHLLSNKAWIAGQWVDAISGRTYPVYNPSNSEIIAERSVLRDGKGLACETIAEVPDMAADDVHRAVREAHTSQQSWATLTAKERARKLRSWYEIMMANKEDLAKLISLEVGKPLQESLGEVVYGASYLEWFSEEAKRVYGDILPPMARNKRMLITKQPVGVAALITPWNFPIAMITRKAAAALAAGCTAVVKPSEETPFCALALAELSSQAGIPPGVFNVLTCSRQSIPVVGQALTSSDLVAKLSFTGSTAVGKILIAQCAETIKRVSMELGGNAPLIIFNSADVGVAVRGTLASKFRNTGQTCISPNRILVQSGIHDRYVEELARAVSKLKQGDPFEEGVNQGPLINEPAVQKVEEHVSDALSKGGEVVVGGGRALSLGNCFFQPSVLVGANTDMQLAHEETFGPVAPIIRFEREAEAIAIANATPFGLAGYFFSRDVSQVWRVSEQLECGLVGVNDGAISSETIPFGGIKQSGMGREGSKYGLEDYLNIKYTCIGNVESKEK